MPRAGTALASDGPRRKAPPAKVKRAVRERQGGLCGCRKQCGAVLPPDGKGLVQYQHDPALGVRPVNAAGTDWIPPQHDPAHLYAELRACHEGETYDGRSGATVLGSDRHSIDKAARIESPGKKPRRKWAHQKMGGRSAWPPKGSRRMGRK